MLISFIECLQSLLLDILKQTQFREGCRKGHRQREERDWGGRTWLVGDAVCVLMGYLKRTPKSKLNGIFLHHTGGTVWIEGAPTSGWFELLRAKKRSWHTIVTLQKANAIYRSGKKPVKWSDSSPLAQGHTVQEFRAGPETTFTHESFSTPRVLRDTVMRWRNYSSVAFQCLR